MKSLVIYFSRTGENYNVGTIDVGNTEIVAEKISELTNSDLFKIEPVHSYSNNYKECVIESRKEFQEQSRPAIKNYLDSIDKYEIIYIGYPIWYGTIPMCVYTFIEHYDFSNKIIKPFSTHEGSELANSVNDLKKALPNSIVKVGLAIKGTEVNTSDNKIKEWI